MFKFAVLFLVVGIAVALTSGLAVAAPLFTASSTFTLFGAMEANELNDE